jgi:heparan-alpha-glucosaminide N-acetyltransferase
MKIDFTQRNVGIDLFRALTMFVMIFVNDFWKIHDVPHWLEHAKRGEDFLGLADVVFPCFLFVVGMSIPFAIERRYSKGQSGESTIGHILSRTLALLVMGAFITNSEARLSPDVSYRIGVYWILMVTAFSVIFFMMNGALHFVRFTNLLN